METVGWLLLLFPEPEEKDHRDSSAPRSAELRMPDANVPLRLGCQTLAGLLPDFLPTCHHMEQPPRYHLNVIYLFAWYLFERQKERQI